MDPLSIIGLTIGGASLLTSLGFGAANAAKKAPTIPGASSGERLAAASSRQLADKLQTGQGLSDTAYNARMSGAQDVAAGQAGQAAGAVRANPFMPGVIANRIVKEAFQKGGQYLAKTQQELQLTDTEQNLANLRASVQAEVVAGEQASNVSEKDQRAAEFKLRMETAQEQALANTLVSVAKGVGSLAYIAGELNAPDKADKTGLTVPEKGGMVGSAITAGRKDATTVLQTADVLNPGLPETGIYDENNDAFSDYYSIPIKR